MPNLNSDWGERRVTPRYLPLLAALLTFATTPLLAVSSHAEDVVQQVLQTDHARVVAGTVVGVAFWVFVAVIVIVPIVLRHLSRRETEKTIRTAIERGQVLDPAIIEKLLAPKRLSFADLMVRGVITVFIGIGIGVLGLFFLNAAHERSLSLYGVGAMIGTIGVGMLLAAWVARRIHEAKDSRDPRV